MTDEQLLTKWREAKTALRDLRDTMRRVESDRTHLTNQINQALKDEEAAWNELVALRNEAGVR